MKKIIVSSIICAMIIMFFSTMVNAATEAELIDKLNSLGAKYGATAADKAKLERYLADNDVTAEQADQIIAKAQEAAAVMDQAGVTDYKKLPEDKKNQLKSIANQAASIAGVTLSYKSGTVEIYKNGKKIDTITGTSGTPATTTTTSTSATTTPTSAGLTQSKKLVYTGNNYNVALILGSVAGIALVSLFIRKKVVNG